MGRYSADRWNYKQTHEYGSGNYRLNGEPGQDALPVLSAKLSKDKQSLFLGIAGMKPSHSLRLTYRLPAPDVINVENAYLTVHALPSLDLTSFGFADNEVDLTPRTDLTGGPEVEPSAALGKEVAMRYGCVACHATGDPTIPAPPVPTATDAKGGAKVAVGPPWIGRGGEEGLFRRIGAEKRRRGLPPRIHPRPPPAASRKATRWSAPASACHPISAC